MRARRRIQKPDVFAEGLSPMQSFLMQDDWRHEISTHDKKKDAYYKPAFLADIMDKYSWGAQGILESYADYIKLKTKIDLTEEKLASYILQSQMCPWVFEFVTAAYNDKYLKAYLDDSKLNDNLKTAISTGKWNTVLNTILADLKNSDYPLAQEVSNRYNMALAQTFVKHVSLKPRTDHQEGEIVEADIAPPAAPQSPAAPAHPGTSPAAPSSPGAQSPSNTNNPSSGQPNNMNSQEEVVQADDETEATELTIKFKPEIKMEDEKPAEVVEADEVMAPDSDKDNAMTDMLDVSNPMGAPYKNIGVSPFPGSGFPERPYEYNVNPWQDCFRSPSPDSLKVQWI